MHLSHHTHGNKTKQNKEQKFTDRRTQETKTNPQS